MKSNILNKPNEKVILTLKSKNEQIEYLWNLLDDISTAGDMFKPDNTNYFRYVNKKCEERGNIAYSIDGQILEIVETDLG